MPLAHHWSSLCDEQVRVPMSHGVDSLNVAASAAIVLYQLSLNHQNRDV